MTDPAMAVAELAKKGPDVDVLRQMAQCMAQRLTEVDVKALCGATYDEKQPGRHKTVARKRAHTNDQCAAAFGGGSLRATAASQAATPVARKRAHTQAAHALHAVVLALPMNLTPVHGPCAVPVTPGDAPCL